ncbi:MAG: site-specific DNA-methyltransferase, partial [Gammaproteobacteria bacterium]
PLLADGGDGKPAFMRYAGRFVRRNTADFFIHRNLKGFLSDELDFYLKSEALNADELARLSGSAIASRMVVYHAIRALGNNIIEALAQWEDLQKALWEKRKFVLQTEYCATLGHIPNLEESGLLDAIAKCDKQWQEWKQLGINGEVAPLFAKGSKVEKRVAWLRENPSLPVDTANFPPEFKDELLAQFSDIDDATDGVLIHGENWQALNLIQGMYKQRIKCAYIDPPYNTGPSEILYKNGLKHSSWLSLMNNRLALSTSLLSGDGLIEVAIDDAELDGLLFLMRLVFGADNYIGTITNMHNPRGRADALHLSPAHEYLVCYAKNYNQLETNQLIQVDSEIDHKYTMRDEISRYRELPFKRSGSNSERNKRPNMFYPIFYNTKTQEFSLTKKNKHDVEIKPIDSQGIERIWRWGKKKFEELAKTEFVAKESQDGKFTINAKDREKANIKPKTVWFGPRFDASSHGTMLIKSMFGESVFDYPKSIHSVVDAIQIATRTDSIVMDYFAGSGTTAHAVINLNREDRGQRKFILVEAGEHFNTVLLPRVKKIIYSPDWKDGKATRPSTSEEVKHGPRLIKYQRTESYEDALANIRFESDGLGLDDDTLHYELDWDTHESPTWLLEKGMDSPFDYQLELVASNAENGNSTHKEYADLPETFAYLLGLRVKTRRIVMDGKRRYLVQRGIAADKDTVVIWRDIAGWKEDDYAREQKFIKESELTKGAERVLLNGNNALKGGESLNPDFGRRMFLKS